MKNTVSNTVAEKSLAPKVLSTLIGHLWLNDLRSQQLWRVAYHSR